MNTHAKKAYLNLVCIWELNGTSYVKSLNRVLTLDMPLTACILKITFDVEAPSKTDVMGAEGMQYGNKPAVLKSKKFLLWTNIEVLLKVECLGTNITAIHYSLSISSPGVNPPIKPTPMGKHVIYESHLHLNSDQELRMSSWKAMKLQGTGKTVTHKIRW